MHLNDPDAQQTYKLLGGTSMGGERPKAVVEDDERLWIAKFNRADDPLDYARIERTMLPHSLRLIREIHEVLLRDARGGKYSPGELRTR